MKGTEMDRNASTSTYLCTKRIEQGELCGNASAIQKQVRVIQENALQAAQPTHDLEVKQLRPSPTAAIGTETIR
jgi:hypothetical protein